jgi:hypothetical protein
MKLFFRIFVFSILICSSLSDSNAQVGINILQPDSSAILHLESTNRGFLPPRLTRQERDNIAAPKPGLMVFNTTDSVMQYHNGDCWISTWQRNCRDCAFNFQLDNNAGYIDRIFSNSDTAQLFVNQFAGDTTTIAVYIVPNLPQGITATLSNFIVNGSDTITLTVNADIFAPPGIYPVIVQAVCGNTIGNQVFIVAVDTCFEVDINTPQTNYNLQVANSLPTNVPICVVARIASGVTLQNTAAAPVFTTGNLHPDSRVGIWNKGDLLARGGNGGAGAGLSGGGSGVGDNGTNALNLTVHTHVVNDNGRLYGGGGGGGSVGLIQAINLGIGTFTLGIGAGGGGGAQAGIGGNLGTGFGYYAAGQNATSGMFALGGDGGILSTPINFNLFGANFTLTPNVEGGDGGDYGIDGTQGTLTVNVLVQISIPLIGNVTLLNQNFPNPPPTGFPVGGVAGNAVKRNGNTMIGNINDGYFQSSNIKGRVGN